MESKGKVAKGQKTKVEGKGGTAKLKKARGGYTDAQADAPKRPPPYMIME